MMDFDTELYVCQMLPTIQCEGDFTGRPSLLIRLLGCNLKCNFCDSKFTWNSKSVKKVYLEHQLDDLKNDMIQTCNGYKINNLMITGGEPTLYRNNPLFSYLILDAPFSTEIETNGTNLMNFPNSPNLYLNISPKLDIKYYKNPDDYNSLIENMKFIRKDNYYYTLKIVDDNREHIFEFLNKCNIPKEEYLNIRIMPKTLLRSECSNQLEFLIELQKSSLKTLKFCMEHGFQFTPRVHLYLFKDEEEKF